MTSVTNWHCCGLKEIYGLLDPLRFILQAVEARRNEHGSKFNLFVFTDWLGYPSGGLNSLPGNTKPNEPAHCHNGPVLARVISELGLGELVTMSEPSFNPNTSHLIQAWLWKPDHEKIKALLATKEPFLDQTLTQTHFAGRMKDEAEARRAA